LITSYKLKVVQHSSDQDYFRSIDQPASLRALIVVSTKFGKKKDNGMG